MAFAARGPQFATLDTTERDFIKARELDLPITLHAGDGLWGLDHPIDQLSSRGLRGPRTTYVHCCTLSDHEFKLIADIGGSVSLSTEVELNMGHGNPATLGAVKHGVRPSISIDICTSVGGDMFTQMRILMAATRGIVNAEALKERKLLDPHAPYRPRHARLSQGARTCGQDRRIGSLTRARMPTWF
jgi:5-methylthioadenosine/S-adenosylhomocysteine deaminase